MGGRDGHAVHVSHANGTHRYQFCRSTLGIGQVGLADLFPDCDHDPSPAHHGAQAQGNGHGNLDPQWNVAGGVIELALEQLHLVLGIGCERDQLVFVDQADGFAGQVHVVAHVGHRLGGHAVEGTVAFYFLANRARQGSQGRDQLRAGGGLANEVAQGLAWVCRQ
ncbi:hypothetical protein D9M71_670480 [compost metagenome]